MRVLLVRHGITDWNSSGRLQGRIDIPLNLEGLSQAHAASKYFKNFEFNAIYSSPLRRAMQTADIIAKNHPNPVRLVDDLMELDFGEWQGLTWQEVRTRYGRIFREFEKTGDLANTYKGESYGEMQKRAFSFLTKLEREDDALILIVTHAGTIKTLVCKILGLDLANRQRFDIYNLSITTLYYSPENGWYVTSLNEVQHMDRLFESGN